jgi:protein translocase SecG subunit
MQFYFIAVALLFITVVLLQQKNSNLGSMMGADSGDEIVQTRRGADRFLHRATVVLAVLFLGGGIYVMWAA